MTFACPSQRKFKINLVDINPIINLLIATITLLQLIGMNLLFNVTKYNTKVKVQYRIPYNKIINTLVIPINII